MTLTVPLNCSKMSTPSSTLASDTSIPEREEDFPLKGRWTGYQHCTKGLAGSKTRLSLLPFPLLTSDGGCTPLTLRSADLTAGWTNSRSLVACPRLSAA